MRWAVPHPDWLYGLGFETAGSKLFGPTIIVVDPATGALLEARNCLTLQPDLRLRPI